MRSLAIVAAVFAAACIPTSARTNAKIEPGSDFALGGGYQRLTEGTNQNGERTDGIDTGHVEAGFQYGWSLSEGALAVQLKVPIFLIYAAIDVYYQFAPLGDGFYAGVGGELGVVPGAYVALTKYVSPELYFTFTPRVLTEGVNPQISLGFDADGAIDLSFFASYLRFFGEGIDIDLNLFGDGDNKDLHKDSFLLGASARF